jgi:hypothetical protein
METPMQEIDHAAESFKLSISFVKIDGNKIGFKNLRKKLNPNIEIENNNIIQGSPFTWGIKVKNIDTKPTPEGVINKYGLRNMDGNYCMGPFPENTPEKILRTLNPEEETIITLDSTVSYINGAIWAFIHIRPVNSAQTFQTHQHNPYHNTDSICYETAKGDNWYDTVYVQDKMELLQNRTNNYILALKVISVWESLFGINKTLALAFTSIAKILELIGSGFSYMANLL